MIRNILVFTLSLFLTVTLWGCSDDSPTGPDLSEAPDAPTLENVEMNLSIFQSAENFTGFRESETGAFDSVYDVIEPFSGDFDPISEHVNAKIQETALQNEMPVFEWAALMASSAQSFFQTMGMFPSIYFQEDMWGEPDVSGDTWIWEWGMQAEGESITMQVTATTTDTERIWELRYSLDTEDVQLEDALLIAAQVALDQSGGSWQLYDFENEDAPVFSVDYSLQGDLTTYINMRIEEEDAHFIYESDGPISSLQMWDVVDEGQTLMNWNNDTGSGSITSPAYRDGETVCWNENFQEAQCL